MHNETKYYNRERKIDFPPSSTTGKYFFVDQPRNEKRGRDAFDSIHENIANIILSFCPSHLSRYYIIYTYIYILRFSFLVRILYHGSGLLSCAKEELDFQRLLKSMDE